MNEVQMKLFMNVVIICGIVLISLSTTLIVRIFQKPEHYSGYQMFIMLLVLITLVCVLVLIFLLGGMAELHSESEKFLWSIKHLSKLTKRSNKRLLKRFRKSCWKITAKFASISYIESLTPLHCIGFSIELTMELLLMTN